jgi:hypothetical protein
VPDNETISRIFEILGDIREKLSGVIARMEERERNDKRTEERLDKHEQRLTFLESFQASVEAQQNEHKDTNKASRDWMLILMTAIAAVTSVVAIMGR